MNNSKKYFLFFLLVTFSSLAHSYVHNQTKAGIAVHWPASSNVVDVYVNSQNSQGLDETLVQSIAATSIAEWNGISRISVRKNSTLGKGQDSFNEIYFSNDPNVFGGGGVIGVTQVGFRDETGEIVDADILINENFPFSTDPTDLLYLGNVITHEVGHFLGLGHGQVSGSTMFYAISHGQHKIAPDDKAGLYSTYPSGNLSMGTLSGNIVGGKNLANVFGTHVQAISVKTGKVMGSAISELDGHFSINGLAQNDQYLIYTSPIKQVALPSNYASVRSDFCEASKKYRGSFFQSCGASSEGFPQAIKLNSSSVNVGNITIRCGLDTPPEYIQNKSVSPAAFDVNTFTQSGLGGSFVGFFSSSEIQKISAADYTKLDPAYWSIASAPTAQQASVQDYFKLDLSHVNWSAVSASTSLFLEVKVSNQIFYSPFKANLSVKRGLSNYTVTPQFIQESDGWFNIDTVERIPINLNIADSSDNSFEFKISPDATIISNFPAGIPSKSDIFPSYLDLQDSLYFYLVTATVVKDNGNGTYTQVASKNDFLSDNTTCPDAVNTYALTNYTAKGISSSSDRKKAVGCGTVDLDDGPKGGGPGGFMVGLIFSFILSYALSRYSKMA